MKADDDRDATWRTLEHTWRSAGFGPIVACALGEHIDAAAAAGDPLAVKVLQRMRPRDVPATVRKIYRDRDLNKLSDYFRRRFPAIKVNGVAVLIAALGRPLRVSPSRSVARDPFLRRKLPANEIAPLAAWVENEIHWINSADWSLSVRQISTIIAPGF